MRKVCLWRRLYAGIMREDKTLIRYTLEDAAKKVKITKKSLDDYLLMIRLGRRYQFDFKNNQKEKFGTLRKFVRIAKSKIRKDKDLPE